MNTLYDIHKTFEENIESGPEWSMPYPEIPHVRSNYSFFGHRVHSRFGVAACPLTHGSKAVALMAKLGYDIITYRSVRSVSWKGQPYPHWRYVDIPKQLHVSDLTTTVTASDTPCHGQEVSMANSFGIQSSSPELWQEDFEKAKKTLTSGQVLILSIMFTPETHNDIVVDAGRVAELAKQTSAEVFEINLAHPNSGMKSLVYEDIQTSVAICNTVKRTLGDRPLVAKVGYYKEKEMLKAFLDQTRGVIDGISSTNTYGMSIVDATGAEAFAGRPKAGVSGAAVRELSLSQAALLVSYKKELSLHDIVIIGIGGVTKPEHIDMYTDLGVDAIQAAAGVFADPLLAVRYKQHIL
jgi:dihydroorotate dehydrogenase